jgi:hypothetical protein
MAMAEWLETYGNPAVLATGGALIGGLFGLFAQRSRFCLRAPRWPVQIPPLMASQTPPWGTARL